MKDRMCFVVVAEVKPPGRQGTTWFCGKPLPCPEHGPPYAVGYLRSALKGRGMEQS